jgi:Fur family ferric uptake transcriptional regulator
MNDTKSKYNTKQRDLIIDYIKTIPHSHFTAADICEHFKSLGINIGVSTVYRHLARLVDEGSVKKFTIDSTSSACFEYGDDCDDEEDICFHCKCVECGKLIHLQCEEIKEISEHLYKVHNFTMIAGRTVFYGLCDECRRNTANS